MTERSTPFIGATRVPWLRPLAQAMRALALIDGVLGVPRGAWDPADLVVVAALVSFLLWRAVPSVVFPARLRNVMAIEVAVTTLGVAVTGGWSSPWLLAQLVTLALVSLGLPALGAIGLTLVAALVNTAASAVAMPVATDVVARVTTMGIVVGFGTLTRAVLVGRDGQDEALGRLEVLWSVRAMLQGLHTEATSSSVTFRVDEAIETLRSSSAPLGAADVVALFALEPDGTLRLLHGVGLPDRTYRVRDLPGRAGQPRSDGVPVGLQLSGGGVGRESVWGGYVWLPVADGDPEHVLVVEHADTSRSVDEVLPELARVAQPLAVTVSNAAWFSRVSHLGVDEERQRIAARLHDQFAQSLAAVSMQLEMAARRHPEDDELRELRGHVTETLGGLRDTMVELRATVDDDHDLEGVLAGLVQRLQERHGVLVQLDVSGDGEPLPATIAQQLLRAVQELTRRAVEDRGAFAVYVRYDRGVDTVTMEVSDDGEAPEGGSRRSIADVVRTRAEAIGAGVVTSHGADGLSRVTITVDRADAPGARQ